MNTSRTERDDAWDVAANVHLLAHIRRTIGRYGKPASYLAMRKTSTPNADASPELIANMKRLIEAKDAWARDMRDIADANNEVPSATQREIWDDYLEHATTNLTPEEA